MIVKWEEKDLYAGRRIQKPDCGITGSLIVGYDAKMSGSLKYGLVSLADGMFHHIGTIVDVAEHLNGCGHYLPAECCPKQWMKE